MDDFIAFMLIMFAFIIGIAIGRKNIICPKCKTPFQLGTSKRNFHQIMWGGWTCQKCGSEIDRKGNLVIKK